MGIDGLDIRKRSAGIGQKIVVNLQPEGADDGEIVPDHEIVDLGDGTGGRVFDRQNAVLTHTLLNGVEDPVKVFEVHNEGAFEDFFTGNLGVSALNTLTGHNGGLGEKLRRFVDGFGNRLVKLAHFSVSLALVAAAQLEEHGVQHPGIVFHFRACHFRNLLQDSPLPGGNKNRQIVGLFIVGNLR